MIHFHHLSTFQVLPALAILTHFGKRISLQTQVVGEENVLAITMP